jgi:hypothetical protein
MHGENRNACRVCVGKKEEGDLKEDFDMCLRIVLKWIRGIKMVWYGRNSCGCRQGPMEVLQ